MKFFPDTFKRRMLAFFGGFALVVALPGYVYLDHVYARELVNDRGAALEDLATAAATVMAENLKERQREINLLAQTPLYRRADLDSPDFKPSLERLQKSYPHYSWIGLADGQGLVRAATADLLVHQDVSQRPWYANGKEGSYLGDLHEAKLLSKLLPREPGQGPLRFMDFSAPVFGEDGALRAVLGAHAHWGWAAEVVKAITPARAQEEGIEIHLLNGQNRVIYPESRPEGDAGPAASPPGPGAFFDNWGGATPYLTARVGVKEIVPTKPVGWSVAVRQPRDAVLAEVRTLQRTILAIWLGAGALFLLLAWWGARRLSHPIEQLADQARRIEQGDEGVELAVNSHSAELRHLVAALRGMASTLVQRKNTLEETNRVLEHRVAERTIELARLNEELQLLARRDALTGLANRFCANERLHEEFIRMKRSEFPYAVVMLDIDFFKRINDTYGHATGDAVLRHVARLIASSIRESDFVGRVGGEEFLIILPGTCLKDALHLGEKIRQVVEGAPAPVAGQVTVSVGVALASPEQSDEDQAVRAADQWLYEAKAAGRNQVLPPKEKPASV